MNDKYVIFQMSTGEKMGFLQIEKNVHRLVTYKSYATPLTLNKARKLAFSLNKEARKYSYYGQPIGNRYGYEPLGSISEWFGK